MQKRVQIKYIWQSQHWPNFTWDSSLLISHLSECRLLQGRLLSKIKALGFPLEQQSQAEMLLEEALTTSAIEGEKLNKEVVRSSVARKLGLPSVGLPKDRQVDGLVDVLLDATKGYAKTFRPERLFSWHAALFPTGYSGLHKIRVGKWRGKEPMRVVSIKNGFEQVHYEAPPYARIVEEMRQFFKWWKNSLGRIDGIIRAGVAHFYFVTIHPFEDGNGRIARALTDMALAEDDKQSIRYYSLSSQILSDRKNYYNILESSQKSEVDLTKWLIWFLQSYANAIRLSEEKLSVVLDKASFWYKYASVVFSPRQQKVINKMLDAGRDKFVGGLTNRKYCSLARVSRATAAREISELLAKGVIKANPGGGRSTSYDLNW